MKAEEFINRKFKTIGLSNPNSYPISFARDVVIRLMEEYAEKQLQKEAIIQLQQLEQIKELREQLEKKLTQNQSDER